MSMFFDIFIEDEIDAKSIIVDLSGASKIDPVLRIDQDGSISTPEDYAFYLKTCSFPKRSRDEYERQLAHATGYKLHCPVKRVVGDAKEQLTRLICGRIPQLRGSVSLVSYSTSVVFRYLYGDALCIYDSASLSPDLHSFLLGVLGGNVRFVSDFFYMD
ncbi:unnamed protein product [Gemmata massiliana]|uniref:Uncharacterized protein n=1 Tax=Gemmata massiliana TaxID=1210884 RepID=A0A6P2D4S0_9BACT|nr:hypothetical protein [Gemmata massiliana]VTR95486.1 unnamed protein product [Gemmata massiliana]